MVQLFNGRDLSGWHLVDRHAGVGNVVLLVTAGGRRACAIPPAEATRVLVHQRYRYRWSAAR